MKWIEQQERILQTQECYSREPMDSILCYFVYVNLENSIEKVTSERIDLGQRSFASQHSETINQENAKRSDDLGGDGNKTVISSEQVLQLIQSNRISTPTTKYIFQESFLYYVDLESENLQQFIQGDNYVDISKRFLQVLPLLDDIVIPPSIFVFHHLNSLYFLFKEVVNKQMAPKSILKGSGTRKKAHVGSPANLENIMFNRYSGLGCCCAAGASFLPKQKDSDMPHSGLMPSEHQRCSRLRPVGSPTRIEVNNMFEKDDGQVVESIKNKRVTMKLVPKIEKGRVGQIRGSTRNTRKIMEN